MAANKRRTTTAIVAGVTAVALLLGGTFAWVSISQMARNEAAGIVNVGGRLHDDFNGTNKDIYVENFTDPYNGGQPIYARIKLTEYMEVGPEAGKLNDDGTDYDADRNASPVIEGTKINDTESWSTHVPIENCAECYENDTLCVFHEHWQWEMGGKTTFMPTFNKDKDSLEADINGTYAGTDATDKIYYDDYVTYVTENGADVDVISGTVDDTAVDNIPAGGSALTEANKDVTTVTDTAYYDNDPDMDVNKMDGQYTTKIETHTAKETVDATVITMAQWKANGSQPGNYWVYDTDGWAYWANPIMPGEATGLLLSNIDMFKNPGEKCYYSINVVGQFATVNDWEKFGVDEEDPDYPSDDALELLDKASQNVPTVTVTNLDGDTLVERGDTVKFQATTDVQVVTAALESDEYEWVVLDENRNITTTSEVVDNGDGTATLTVGDGEMSAGLYVAARSKAYGAVGTSAVAVQLYTVTIDGDDTVNANKTKQFSASVTDSNTGEAENSGVTWSVFGGNGTAAIDETGLLTVDTTEADGAALTVRATSVNGGFTDTHTVTVANKYAVTVSADSKNIDRGDTLQFEAEVTQNGETVASDVTWTVTGGSATTNIDKDGLLTVDANEKEAASLTVTAISNADGTARGTYTVNVNKYTVSVTADGATTVEAGKTLQLNADVTKNGKSDDSGVYWAVSSKNRMTTISPTGLLEVDYTVGNNTPLTVTATSKADKNISTTYTVTVIAERELQITANSDSVDPGGSLQYSASFLVNGVVFEENPAVTWSVADSQGNSVSHASIDESGKLTVSGTEYGTSELYVHAEYAAAETTSSLSVANVAYTLTLEAPNLFHTNGLRVTVKEVYYRSIDITVAFSNNTGATRYKYTAQNSPLGLSLQITHDDNYYAYADHGTRTLTVTTTGGETASINFACNSHENTDYTIDSESSILDHADKREYFHKMRLVYGNSDIFSEIEGDYLKWDVKANNKAPGTRIDDDGLLTLAEEEYSPYVTVIFRTENAWGMKDIRVRYAESDYVMQQVKNLRLHLLSRENELTSANLRNNPSTVVTHGMNQANPELGNGGWTYDFRLYRSNLSIIEEPLNLSIWVGDTNITGSGGGGYTNDYNSSTSRYGDGHGYYWIWSSNGNVTPVTFWISYVDDAGDVGTFEATVW